MNLTLVTPPPHEPVSLAQVYQHLRLDTEGDSPTHPDDTLLGLYLTAAREEVEAATRRTLVRTTWRLSAGGFPYSGGYSGSYLGITRPQRLLLLRPPLVQVLAVEYYDADNVLQVYDPASYYVTDDVVPELRLTTASAPPATYDRPDALRVTYVAGYAPAGSPPTTQEDYAASVPKDLQAAILFGVQMRYDMLTPGDRTAMEAAMNAMMQKYRVQLMP